MRDSSEGFSGAVNDCAFSVRARGRGGMFSHPLQAMSQVGAPSLPGLPRVGAARLRSLGPWLLIVSLAPV